MEQQQAANAEQTENVTQSVDTTAVVATDIDNRNHPKNKANKKNEDSRQIYFDANPGVPFLFFCSDGTAFYTESPANEHAATLSNKSVEKVAAPKDK